MKKQEFIDAINEVHELNNRIAALKKELKDKKAEIMKYCKQHNVTEQTTDVCKLQALSKTVLTVDVDKLSKTVSAAEFILCVNPNITAIRKVLSLAQREKVAEETVETFASLKVTALDKNQYTA